MDFLAARNDAAIRKELTGIRDSYHHYWDLIAELLQNSRDAITRKRAAGHQGPFFIRISIDPASNTIEVFDNGAGIEAARLTEMFAPGGGDKGLGPEGSNEVGEKGVGLTYAIFSCNDFVIATKTLDGSVTGGKIKNAQRWLNADQGLERPAFESATPDSISASFEKIDEVDYPLDSFTRIRAGAIMPPEGDVNVFRMSQKAFRWLLRTRTAVGVTTHLFSDNVSEEFAVFLSFTSPSGTHEERVSATFLAPHTLVSTSSLLPLEVVRDAFVSRSDATARKKYLQKKTVWARETTLIEGWSINVYGVMFPDNDALRDLSRVSLGLSDTEQESIAIELLENGIFVGTKGMPTGMKIAPKTGTGRYPAYYKRCFFFVESPNLKFDLGRKSLHYRHVNKLQTAVANLFGRFEDIAPFQGDSRAEPGKLQITPAERRAVSEAMWREAEALPDLNEASVRYEKHPNSQEAAVAAIFHELIGAGVLPAYRTWRTGYGERYDLHALYIDGDRKIKIVIEFKYALESLVRDLSENQKYFSDIDLLVAWDADAKKLAAGGFYLDANASASYAGATHTLSVPLPGIDPIPVILLRTFLDRRRSDP
jgi:hypothetical protein